MWRFLKEIVKNFKMLEVDKENFERVNNRCDPEGGLQRAVDEIRHSGMPYHNYDNNVYMYQYILEFCIDNPNIFAEYQNKQLEKLKIKFISELQKFSDIARKQQHAFGDYDYRAKYSLYKDEGERLKVTNHLNCMNSELSRAISMLLGEYICFSNKSKKILHNPILYYWTGWKKWILIFSSILLLMFNIDYLKKYILDIISNI